MKPAKNRFKALGDVAGRLHGLGGATFERLAILDQVWGRLYGHRLRHWRLEGAQGGTLYVKATSPAAAQELRLHAREMVKELNKHFLKDWIRVLKAV